MAFARLAFLALFLWGISGASTAQAIDCASSVLNHSERAVCASEPLRALAASIDRRYARVADNLGVKQSQLEWTRVRDRCNGNLACLTTAYRERNAYLAGLPVSARPSAAASAQPIKHLFLRHAPAQLLSPSPAVAPTPSMDAVSASERLARAAGPAPAVSQPPHWSTLWFLGAMLLASVLLWQMLTNVCGKCPSCHHWFARVEIDRRQLASDAEEPAATRRRLSLRSRATAGPLAGTNAGLGRRAAVRHYNQCRICLHEWETVTQETK
jgi:hypothetical protein